MEEHVVLVEGLYERARHFAKVQVELYRLKVIAKSAEVISNVASSALIFVTLAVFFLILNIGVALWLGEILGRSYYGFFSMAGFYALVIVLFYLFGDQLIKKPIRNSIVEHALK